ncbi:glycosyltransferase family 4 protein [Flavobacteriaceae bacterium]|nr:glycosyltransferase family 4 protein [Flavobacteriaceae bacterium]
MVKKIALIHSGVQHLLQTTLALQKAQMLNKVYTSFVFKSRIKRIFSSGKINKILNLRDFSLVDNKLIHLTPKYEVIELILKLVLGKNNFTTNILPTKRDIKFSKKISKKISNDVDGILAFPNNALETFEKFPDLLKVIEQPIGHKKIANELFKEEVKLNPIYADSISFFNENSASIDRINKELDLCDMVFAPSNFVKSTLIQAGVEKSKIKLNPYGSFVETSSVQDIQFNDKSRVLKILFVGQLTQRKGISYLFDALRICKEDIKIEFTMVGEIFGKGLWYDDVSKLISRHIKSIPRNELQKLMLESDIFILPSLFEGSALVVYEALASGCVCIVSENTGADSVKDFYNGFVVPIRDSEIIAQKILFLNEQRETLHKMKLNALLSANSFSWNKYGDRLVNFLDEYNR